MDDEEISSRTTINIPKKLREELTQVRLRLRRERGRRVTVQETIEYLIEQEKKSVAP